MSAKNPRDQIGNRLDVNDFVTLLTGQPLCFRIIAMNDGGIDLANGRKTPAAMRIICDMTLAFPPGGAIPALLKVVNPTSENAVDNILSMDGSKIPPSTQ